MKILLVVFSLIIAYMVFLIFFIIAFPDGGSGMVESGRVMINDSLTTDAEYVAKSTVFLRKIGWWGNNSFLFGLSRNIDCSQGSAPSGQRLLRFRKFERLLFRTIVKDVTIEFNEDGTEFNYRLEENDWLNGPSFEELNLSNIRIDSDKALNLAEKQGGDALRARLGNNCNIHLDLHAGENWEIDYTQKSSFDCLLCLDIDPYTGDVGLIK